MQKARGILVCLAALVVLQGLAMSAEFLIYDGDRNFTESDRGFMYYYRLGNPYPSTWPGNWLSPVDYYRGYWMVRYEIKSKPTAKGFSYQCCIWQLPPDGNTSTAAEYETCSGPYTQMTGPGVYTTKTNPCINWWKKNGGANAVDFDRPRDYKRLGLVYRTSSGCYVTSYNVTPNCWDQRADYLPVVQHITLVAVSAGATFSGWGNYGFGNPTVMAPSFSPAPGTFTGSVVVSISCGTAGASIRYTTDGSIPTATSPAYSQALTFTSTTTLRAIGIKSGMDNSTVTVGTYVIQVDNTPPVIASASSSGDPTLVSVAFNEAVDQATAQTVGNYAINNGVSISTATLGSDNKTVTLKVSTLSEGTTYTLTVNNIKDLSGNTIAANSTKTFQYLSGWTDDFNDGNYTTNQTWTVGEGTWAVTSGALGNTSSSGRTSIYGGEATWTDLTFSADVKPVSGTNVNDVWLIFRVQDASNYYLYTLETGKLYKLVNGNYTELASGSGTYTTGTTYNMKVELSGSSIKVYRNGTQVLSANDNTFTSGKVGFGSNNATGTFDNVEVLLPTGMPTPELLYQVNKNTLAVFPNPAQSSAIIRFTLDKQDYVELKVFDNAGREVSTLLSGTISPDTYQVNWNTAELPRGVYLYKLVTGQGTQQRGRVLLQ